MSTEPVLPVFGWVYAEERFGRNIVRVSSQKIEGGLELVLKKDALDAYQAGLKAGREQGLEEAAKKCEEARPAGGRVWTEGQAACYEALTHVANHIRSMAEGSAG